MTNCLYCDSPIRKRHTWQSMLGLVKEDKFLCGKCLEKLVRIEGELCKRCGRVLESQYAEGEMCLDCVKWEGDGETAGLLIQNRSLFAYNEFMKDVIAKFKFRGDYVLIKAFENEFFQFFQHVYPQKMEIVPIPLSETRLGERGFNQAEAIATLLGQPLYHLLSRPHHEKQSKKSRSERLHTLNDFQINGSCHGDTILLVDDIYTTGSTLVQAAAVLKENGAVSVSSLTLARS